MANQIARLRAALKLSRTDFGKELGVVRTTVMRWEKGEMSPPTYIQGALVALAFRHGVDWKPDSIPHKKKKAKLPSAHLIRAVP